MACFNLSGRLQPPNILSCVVPTSDFATGAGHHLRERSISIIDGRRGHLTPVHVDGVWIGPQRRVASTTVGQCSVLE